MTISHSDKQSDLLEMMATNEEAIARLYEAYSVKFTNYKEFWLQLASEEMHHSSWISNLKTKGREGGLYINEGRFKREAIQTFSDYLNRELIKAQTQDISLITALSTALYIEQSIIEHQYFEVFETDSVELKHLLMELSQATDDHLNRVKIVWSENR